MLLKLSSHLALKQNAIILSKRINDHSFIPCTGVVQVLFSPHNPVRVQGYRTGQDITPSVTEACLPWVYFPNYMELFRARALNPASWLTAAL